MTLRREIEWHIADAESTAATLRHSAANARRRAEMDSEHLIGEASGYEGSARRLREMLERLDDTEGM